MLEFTGKAFKISVGSSEAELVGALSFPRVTDEDDNLLLLRFKNINLLYDTEENDYVNKDIKYSRWREIWSNDYDNNSKENRKYIYKEIDNDLMLRFENPFIKYDGENEILLKAFKELERFSEFDTRLNCYPLEFFVNGEYEILEIYSYSNLKIYLADENFDPRILFEKLPKNKKLDSSNNGTLHADKNSSRPHKRRHRFIKDVTPSQTDLNNFSSDTYEVVDSRGTYKVLSPIVKFSQHSGSRKFIPDVRLIDYSSNNSLLNSASLNSSKSK